ncbi:efflux RND transporter periplasmic adaptor subunit [Aquabacterium sp.]|uniref:efflux RND transporter periplasmic adaptor subunit n=1 Tax=Aquabacterium sp. TaxID=1872578 RepID=UPI0025B8C0B2|nr:efflux RND transporter periplasmic adaptor subunit [Aquabacterium sp.]
MIGLIGLSGLCAQALAAPPAPIQLTPTQVRNLGIEVAGTVASAGAWQAYPAEIVVPPTQQRVVAAPVAGLVEALSASPGDTVRAGQVLVSLRSAEPQALQRDVLQSGSQLDLAQRQLARDEALYAEGLIPQSRLDATRAQLTQARAQASERQSALKLASGQTRPDAQGRISLAAPVAGQVLAQLVAVGERVDAMAPLYRIASLQTLWLDIQVPAREAARVQPGDRVELSLPGDPKAQGLARVLTLGATVEGRSQTLTVRARIDTSTPGTPVWRPGQIVQARIQRTEAGSPAQGSKAGGAVTLPPGALLPVPGAGHQVFVQGPAGRFSLQPVTLLSQQADQATVTGLPAGAQVVVRGTAALKALVSTTGQP